VDEIKDVVPITEHLGLWHPQEGIVKGHLQPTEGQQINIIGQLRYGCTKVVEDLEYVPEGGAIKHAVADLITGYGVAESVRHFYDLYYNSSPAGKSVVVQGWGNVASAAACYLAKEGARIVGIIDRDGGLLSPEGLTLEQVKLLFNTKNGNKLNTPDLMPFHEINDKIWKTGADIFIPGAASKLVTRAQVDQLLEGGIELVACGANVPFVDDGVFFGPTARYTDERTAVIPDFVANCGMARVFAYLMQPDATMTDRAIFGDISATIRRAIEEVIKINHAPKEISSNALYLALRKLGV
jgi:glutamate dehydrogenase/leucine dehydrogenase